MCSNLRQHLHWRAADRLGRPDRIDTFDPANVEQLRRPNRHLTGGDVDVDHVTGSAVCWRIRDVQAPPLADREGEGAVVLSEDVTGCRIDDLARHASESAFEEPRRVTVRNEADVMAIRLARDEQTALLCLSSHCGLEVGTEGEYGALKLVSSQDAQDVGLILLRVRGPMEFGTVRALDDLRVVAGRNCIEVQGERSVEDCAELDLLVAAQAGIGRSTALVLGDEIVDNVRCEPLREIPDIEGNAEHVGHAPCISSIIEGAAASRTGSIRMRLARQGKVDAHDLMPGIDDACCGNGRVDASRHRRDDPHDRALAVSLPALAARSTAKGRALTTESMSADVVALPRLKRSDALAVGSSTPMASRT